MTASEWQAVVAGFAGIAVAAATLSEKLRGSAKDQFDRESSRERLSQEAQEKLAAQLQSQLVALYTENQALRDRWTQMFADWRADNAHREQRETELLARADHDASPVRLAADVCLKYLAEPGSSFERRIGQRVARGLNSGSDHPSLP